MLRLRTVWVQRIGGRARGDTTQLYALCEWPHNSQLPQTNIEMFRLPCNRTTYRGVTLRTPDVFADSVANDLFPIFHKRVDTRTNARHKWEAQRRAIPRTRCGQTAMRRRVPFCRRRRAHRRRRRSFRLALKLFEDGSTKMPSAVVFAA